MHHNHTCSNTLYKKLVYIVLTYMRQRCKICSVLLYWYVFLCCVNIIGAIHPGKVCYVTQYGTFPVYKVYITLSPNRIKNLCGMQVMSGYVHNCLLSFEFCLVVYVHVYNVILGKVRLFTMG
jgi:hypothetical protein